MPGFESRQGYQSTKPPPPFTQPANGKETLVNDRIRLTLDSDRLVDITTTGRKTGKQHRIEVGLRHLDGHIYLSNSPGTRDWAANLLAKPEFTYHLKQSARIDVPARATPVTDVDEKRKLLTDILAKEDHLDQLEARMEGSRLFRVEVLGGSTTA